MKRENYSSGVMLLPARGGPSPGKQLVEAIVRPEIDQADENIGEPGLRLDVVQFAGLCRLPNYAEWSWKEPVVCRALCG